MLTTLAMLPAKLDQPDHPIGMGKAFVLLLVIVGLIAVICLMVGIRKPKRRDGDIITEPVLLRPQDKVSYRGTHAGRPTRPQK